MHDSAYICPYNSIWEVGSNSLILVVHEYALNTKKDISSFITNWTTVGTLSSSPIGIQMAMTLVRSISYNDHLYKATVLNGPSSFRHCQVRVLPVVVMCVFVWKILITCSLSYNSKVM